MSLFDEFYGEEPEPEPVEIPGQIPLTGLGGGQLNVLDEIDATNTEDDARRLAGEWIGLPAFGSNVEAPKVVVSFDSEADRQRFLGEIGVETIHKNTRGTLSVWWPPRDREDLSSLRFES